MLRAPLPRFLSFSTASVRCATQSCTAFHRSRPLPPSCPAVHYFPRHFAISPRRSLSTRLRNTKQVMAAMPVAEGMPEVAALPQASVSADASDRIDLSLERIRVLLQQLGNPHHAFPVIHVAGTNAKGSTIAYLDAILRDVVGVQTGTFTTPHLVTQRDSCRVGGHAVDETAWQRAAETVKDAAASAAIQCTPFEKLTAQTFMAFSLLPAETKPQVLLIEVGMGGTLDATNVFTDKQVLASVIGAIDFDHQGFLGDTLGEIASHKAGIIKPNGLCILADQRRPGAAQDEEAAVLRVDPALTHLSGRAQEIVEAVRRKCADESARLVLNAVPWRALSLMYAKAPPGESAGPVPVYTRSVARFSPILSPSKARAGSFVASTGDSVVPGPDVELPATRASLMGAHLAMQTLWSIARDESPCGLGLSGSDDFEELRLAIAFAMRDDGTAHAQLSACVERVQLAGRAEWQRFSLPSPDPHNDGNNNDDDVSVLIDGAHNPSAALALGQYVRACATQSQLLDGSPSTDTIVTWVLAFTQGKEFKLIVENLLGISDSLTQQMQDVDLNALPPALEARTNVCHRIAVVPFITPVEGMPWVKPCDPSEVATIIDTLKVQHADTVIECATFGAEETTSEPPLIRALRWAKQPGAEAPMRHLTVIAGSLYLVSDAHRLIQGASR